MTFSRAVAAAVAAVAAVLLTACPGLQPVLQVNPAAVSFGTSDNSHTLQVRNLGGGMLTWTAEEVQRNGADDGWISAGLPWLELSDSEGEVTAGVGTIRLSVNRNAAQGNMRGGVRIQSNGGEHVVPVSLSALPALEVSPREVNLAPLATRGEFTIINNGESSLGWTLRWLPDPDDPSTAAALPEDLMVTPATQGQTPAGDSTAVVVTWTQQQEDFHLLVESDSGSAVVSFRFGAVLEGLDILPNPLRLYVEDTETSEPAAATTLRIRNRGGVAQSWTLEVDSVGGAAAPIFIETQSGTTPAGLQSEVDVAVSDPSRVEAGSGHYELVLRSGDSFFVIPIIVEVQPLPAIAISEQPQASSTRPEIIPLDVLDFGQTAYAKAFWLANIGTRGSQLYFRISYEEQGESDALIAGVEPLTGNANGTDEDFFLPGENILIDGVPISVTVDRRHLQEDVEFRTITIQAVQSDLETPVDAVEPETLRVRVERQPLTVEGALNRSRPPYVMRFVFLARDSVGDVIPTQTQEQRDRLNFTIVENDELLDLDETSVYTTNDLRVNLALVLDFTGSMYNAGTRRADNPLAPGEAIERMKAAAIAFVRDLPPTYNVALLYYSDRQQTNRLLHQFSTDRQSLTAALEQFWLAPAQHGASQIHDTLIETMGLLNAQDPVETLPFDDADVRAIVYVTDGEDNASQASAEDVVRVAQDTRVRLYPVAYSPNGDDAETAKLVGFAQESGGHLYGGGSVAELRAILGTTGDLVLEQSDISGTNAAYFRIRNTGSDTSTWSIDTTGGQGLIKGVQPQVASTPPGGVSTVTVQFDPAAYAPNTTVESELTLYTPANDSDNAWGRVVVTAPIVDGGGGVPAVEGVSLRLFDTPGRIWEDLRNQLVLTYITPQSRDFEYLIRGTYTPPSGNQIQGEFLRSALAYPGDVRAGQLSLYSAGIQDDLSLPQDDPDARGAEIFVRANYVPRNVTRFAMRFFLRTPDTAPAGVAAALDAVGMDVDIAPGGLLDDPDESGTLGWRLLPQGDQRYLLVTDQDNPLPYGAFGNLLRIRLTNLQPLFDAYAAAGQSPELLLGMRVDNAIYLDAGGPVSPGDTKYFLYPGGPTNPQRLLRLRLGRSDGAAPALTLEALQSPGIDPEAPTAWDQDEDGLPDYFDPAPFNDGVPGSLAVPNPLTIPATDDVAQIRVRNNRLDTFAWQVVAESLPAWVSRVTHGEPPPADGEPGGAQQTPLAPGEEAVVNLHIDRTGLTPGSQVRGSVLIDTDLGFLGTEEVALTLEVPEE